MIVLYSRKSLILAADSLCLGFWREYMWEAQKGLWLLLVVPDALFPITGLLVGEILTMKTGLAPGKLIHLLSRK